MAIIVSTEFKEAMKAPVKVLSGTLRIDGDEYTSNDNLMNFSIEASGIFMGATTKVLEFRLLGVDYDLLLKDVNVELSVQAEEGWESCNFGNFKIYEQDAEVEKGCTKFKAYDRMGDLAYTLYDGSLSFPCTVSNLIEQISTKFGYNYEPLAHLPNGNYEIKEDLYSKINNCTYRDILSEIAGATTTNISISGSDNNLVLKLAQKSTEESLTYDNLKKISYKPLFGPVNTIVLARTPAEDNIVYSDEQSVETHGNIEIKIANNEILDDDRETVIVPILESLDSLEYYPFEASTEGHGWHECGDRISVVSDGITHDILIDYVKVVIDGGIKETLKGSAPDENDTNYALAGGITKTIYNTEIKVDKQNQEINSLVSKTDQMDNRISENYTQVNQTINNITNVIQESGGSNLIYNSVGFDKATDGVLAEWTTVGTVRSSTSPESINYGATSGNQIIFNASSKLTQRISVSGLGKEYSIAFRVRKSAPGSAKIKLTNEIDNFEVTIPANEECIWQKFEISPFTPSMTYLDLTIETDENIVDFYITDLILVASASIASWSQASGEILNTQVSLTKNGVKVRSSVYDGDYTEITPLEFAGYSSVTGSSRKVFSLNRDTTTVEKLKAETQITMPPIKIVPITSGSNAGWAFVKGDS